MTPKIKKILIILYIVMLVLGTTFVASVLKTRSVQVLNKEPDPTTIEIKPITVSLQVTEGNKTSTYVYTLRNVDSVVDLLNKARDDKKIYFEKTQYTNSVVIDNVNNSKSDQNFGWRIFTQGQDITNHMENWKLVDNGVYQLMLTPIKK